MFYKKLVMNGFKPGPLASVVTTTPNVPQLNLMFRTLNDVMSLKIYFSSSLKCILMSKFQHFLFRVTTNVFMLNLNTK